MAIQNGTLRHLENGLLVFAVENLANGNQTTAIDLGLRAHELAAQFTGTPGATPSVSIEKSNEGATWVGLAAGDIQSGTHPVTAAGIIEFKTAARFVRFNCTAGDGTTAWDIALIAHPGRG